MHGITPPVKVSGGLKYSYLAYITGLKWEVTKRQLTIF